MSKDAKRRIAAELARDKRYEAPGFFDRFTLENAANIPHNIYAHTSNAIGTGIRGIQHFLDPATAPDPRMMHSHLDPRHARAAFDVGALTTGGSSAFARAPIGSISAGAVASSQRAPSSNMELMLKSMPPGSNNLRNIPPNGRAPMQQAANVSDLQHSGQTQRYMGGYRFGGEKPKFVESIGHTQTPAHQRINEMGVKQGTPELERYFHGSRKKTSLSSADFAKSVLSILDEELPADVRYVGQMINYLKDKVGQEKLVRAMSSASKDNALSR